MAGAQVGEREGIVGLDCGDPYARQVYACGESGSFALHHHLQTTMSASNQPTPPVAPIPEHLHTVTPRLVLSGAAEAIEFYRRAFGAEEVGERFTGPGGGIIHAELRIGDSIVMITDEEDEPGAGEGHRGAGECDPGAGEGPPRTLGAGSGAIMATYWENVDAAWERALAAGAEVLHPLADQFYGERGGRLRDPYGQQWMLAQRIEDLSREEIAGRAKQFFAADE
jgi:PhnB protein